MRRQREWTGLRRHRVRRTRCRRSNENPPEQQEEQGCGGSRGHGPHASGKALTIMYTYEQRVVGKVSELACTVGDIDPDLILVTETWCNSEITDTFLTTGLRSAN